MLNTGVDLRDVQIAARHTNPRTTMRYDGACKNLDRHPNVTGPNLLQPRPELSALPMSGQSGRSDTPPITSTSRGLAVRLDRSLWSACDGWISVSRRGGELDDAGLRSARAVLLRPRGLEPSGDGLERSDQLLELRRLQCVVGGFCEGVGQ
jgi:hypothetical protein